MTPVRSLSHRLRPLPVVVALFTLVALWTSSTSAQKPVAGLSPETIARIEKVITSEMATQGVPGMSIAIATDLQLRWANGYGLADLENFVPATAATNYRMASIHKSFTAVAAMQLVEAGKLDLDAPIQGYAPAFPQKKWPVTARNILYHVSGIRGYKGNEMNETRYFPTLTEGISSFKDDPLEYEPGTRYLYSTQGYMVLQLAIEGASGMSYYDYIQKHVFDPAGMDTATVDSVRAIIPHRAQGYIRDDRGQLRNSALADTSSKGCHAGTAVDLVKFGIAFLSGKLVKPETVQEMFKVHPATYRVKTNMGYGLGFNVAWRGPRQGEGVLEVYKAGNQQRVTGLLYMRPGQNFVMAFFYNLENVPHTAAFVREITEIVLEQTAARP